LLLAAASAQADSNVWKVATVHGQNQFTIGPNQAATPNTSLLYERQGWTNYVWYNNNGSPPGTVATTTYGPNAPAVEPRSGMRTFATTDVAVGRKLSDIKLQFEYHGTMYSNPATPQYGYPTINFIMTDGAGKFGIFAPTSLGLGAVATEQQLNGWWRMTMDLTSGAINPAAACAVYEHNGFVNNYGVPFTTMTWNDIKDYTIAGMYDYARSPTNGWGAWGTMFDQINTAGSSTIVNGYGLALIWGDTANSSNAYGLQQREIRNVDLAFRGQGFDNDYDTFGDATVPEPATLTLLLGLGLAGAARAAWRRKK
jgi:hypothetical protein